MKSLTWAGLTGWYLSCVVSSDCLKRRGSNRKQTQRQVTPCSNTPFQRNQSRSCSFHDCQSMWTVRQEVDTLLSGNRESQCWGQTSFPQHCSMVCFLELKQESVCVHTQIRARFHKQSSGWSFSQQKNSGAAPTYNGRNFRTHFWK